MTAVPVFRAQEGTRVFTASTHTAVAAVALVDQVACLHGAVLPVIEGKASVVFSLKPLAVEPVVSASAVLAGVVPASEQPVMAGVAAEGALQLRGRVSIQ